MEKSVALVSSQRIGRDDGLSWIGKCETLYAIVESNRTMSYVGYKDDAYTVSCTSAFVLLDK